MSLDARATIEAHRLLRTPKESVADLRIRDNQDDRAERKKQQQQAWVRRSVVHTGAFATAFVFTAGVAVVCILLWVRPDTLLPLVLVSVFCSLVFVTVFAMVRMLVLHKLLDEYPNKEEDPGIHHHWGKSIAYGFLALVAALLLTGLLVNVAAAVTT